MKNKELDFLLHAIRAGDFDEEVIKLLEKLIADYKRLKQLSEENGPRDTQKN